jgi:hypothetical protein
MGGLRGAPFEALVVEGESNWVAVKAEEVGRLLLDLGADLCTASPRLDVFALPREASATGLISARPVVALPTASSCRFDLAGLKPGTYLASVKNKTGELARAEISIVAQTVVQRSLSASSTIVLGAVTFNGGPFGDATIELLDETHRSVVATTTAADGTYQMVVGQPGSYTARLLAGKMAVGNQHRQLSLADGSNQVNWSLIGGELTVSLPDWDRSSRLQLSIKYDDGEAKVYTDTTASYDATDQYPFRFVGVPFGQYTVSARTADGRLAARSEPLRLDHKLPSRHVTLHFDQSDLDVQLIDRVGLPVGPVIVDGATSATSPDKGVLRLKGIQPGRRLRFRSPVFAPLCVEVPTNSRFLRLTMDRGRSVEVRTSPDLDLSRVVVTALEGQCSYPLSMLQVMRFPEESGQARLRIENFPIEQTVIEVGSTRYIVRRDEAGPIVIR